MALRRTASLMEGGFLKQFSEAYIKASGYRKYGLKAEDLIMEEIPECREALSRMPQDYTDLRYFRLKRAMNESMKYTYLPAEMQTKPEEDTQDLVAVIKQVKAEIAEKEAWDNQAA
eukprot:m.20121 g.20121  ORF g.20121 m.20121 type:complete len:116 (+) comp6756_c0_seq1:33-380(+)